jgi:hypothetical protein
MGLAENSTPQPILLSNKISPRTCLFAPKKIWLFFLFRVPTASQSQGCLRQGSRKTSLRVAVLFSDKRFDILPASRICPETVKKF